MKDLLTSFLSTGVIQLINIATGILAARLLLPEGRGELAALILWPVLVAELGALGVHSAVVYFGSRKTYSTGAVTAAASAILFAVTPVLVAAMALLIPHVYDGAGDEFRSVAWIYLAIIPAHLASLSLLSVFQGEMAFTEYNVLRSLNHLFYLVFIGVFVMVEGATVRAFAFAYLAAAVTPLAIALPIALRRGWMGLAPRADAVRALLHYGARAHVPYILGVANRRLDQALISIWLAASDLGLYVVALAVQGLPMLVTNTMDILTFPKIAAAKTEDERAVILGRYLRATLILAVPFALALVAVTPWLLDLVFGEAFRRGAATAQILVLATLPYALKVPLTTWLRASDRMRIVSQAEALAVVVTAATLAALLPLLGTEGAAIAQIFAFAIPTAFIAWRARAEYGLDLGLLFRFDADDLVPIREALARITGRSETPP